MIKLHLKKEGGKIMKIAVIVSSIVSVIIGIFLLITGYNYTRDIDALIDRAQVSADREDMIEYMTQLKKNMENIGMTHGYTALVFKTPANNMALHYKTVNRILERLESIKNIPKNETAYQVALDDIRGTIRELPNPTLGWLWVQYWFLFIGGSTIWIWPCIIWIKTDYYF